MNGANAHPLFKYLRAAKRGLFGTQSIKWNFTKFLVGKDGEVLTRFGPATTPESIEKSILPLLS